MKFLKPVYEMCDGSYGGHMPSPGPGPKWWELILMRDRRNEDRSRWLRRIFG